jgi:hypothetical protein
MNRRRESAAKRREARAIRDSEEAQIDGPEGAGAAGFRRCAAKDQVRSLRYPLRCVLSRRRRGRRVAISGRRATPLMSPARGTPTPHCIVPFRFTGAASASGCWVQKRHGIMLR